MNDQTENVQQDDFNDEEWFNEQARPLVNQLYKLCEEHNIPFIAAFAYGLDTARVGDDRHQRFHMGGSCHLPSDRSPCEMRVAQRLIFDGFEAASPHFLAHIAQEALGMRKSYTERDDQVPAGATVN